MFTEIVIAILLWLGCIESPGSYSATTIGAYQYQHQPFINYVQTDSILSATIWQQHGSAVEEVKIIQPL